MDLKLIEEKNIINISKDGLCIGCGTCAAMCPHSAIKMEKDDTKGIFIPYLNLQECIKCGICYECCPGYSPNLAELSESVFSKASKNSLIGDYLNCYCGFATDYGIRYNAASGGLVTSILIYALDEKIIDGALVTRMKNSDPLEPEPFIARTKDELIEASKSKYCPVPANIALKEILKQEGRYAVVGLPCHIHGVRKAEKINKTLKDRIILHLSIFCSGVPNFMATEFLLYKKDLKEEEIRSIDYRGDGWPGYMSLCLKNNEKIVLPYPGYKDGETNLNLFLPTLFIHSRCTVCPDWFSELADISFGDAWLSEIKNYDKIGTSVIISRTKKGEDILIRMLNKGVIALRPLSSDKILESQPGFFCKKKQLKVQLFVFRILDKKIPIHNYCNSDNISFRDYFEVGFFHILRFFASKRILWRLLDIFHLLSHQGSILKCKLGF